MTYLGLALLAVGMWGQQRAVRYMPNGTIQDCATCSGVVNTDVHTHGGDLTHAAGEPTVVPAIQEDDPPNGPLGQCANIYPCTVPKEQLTKWCGFVGIGFDSPRIEVCSDKPTTHWTCPDKSNYELHSTMDGSKHWCERAPKVATQ